MEQYALGIDLGGTNIKGVLANDAGEVLAWREVSTGADGGLEGVLNRIGELVRDLKADFGDSPEIPLGIGVPAMMDYDNGRVILAPNLKWRNIPLREMLQDRFKQNIQLDNDGNTAALGEAWIGAGRGISSFALITIGTGIGSGIIHEGRIFRGASGLAPELGHMSISSRGLECNCGRRGCLETFCSAPAILESARSRGMEINTNSTKEIMDLAKQGSSTAVKVVQEAMDQLGAAMANIKLLFDPQIFIIGGGVADSSEVFMEYLRRRVIENMPVSSDIKIVKAKLGNKAGALGAARMAFLEKVETKLS
ncbi:MAG: ROK family protein [Clostridia bacterium]|nr:ROK family protein [Clostridia bacterium]